MSYRIVTTYRFEKELKRLVKKFSSLKDDYADLIKQILAHPASGTFMGNNCYKIRLLITSKNKGKSGGARVITHLYMQAETIYLLSIYDKGEKSDLKPNEIKEMVDALDLD